MQQCTLSMLQNQNQKGMLNVNPERISCTSVSSLQLKLLIAWANGGKHFPLKMFTEWPPFCRPKKVSRWAQHRHEHISERWLLSAAVHPASTGWRLSPMTSCLCCACTITPCGLPSHTVCATALTTKPAAAARSDPLPCHHHRNLVQMFPSLLTCTGYTVRSIGFSLDLSVPSRPLMGLSFGHHLST